MAGILKVGGVLALSIIAFLYAKFFYVGHIFPSKDSVVISQIATSTIVINTPATSSSTSISTSTNSPLVITVPTSANKDTKKASIPVVMSSQDVIKSMHITFDDEFNSFSRYVDKNGNVTCYPGGYGTWQTVYHFCSRTIFTNYEAEVYTDPNFISYLNKNNPQANTTAHDPISISNGILAIEAAPSDEVIRKSAGSWAKYTSGLITTQFSFSQKFGYFEMRAKLPVGKGLWPAFWLLPIDKTWPPEIDVMEAFGEPNKKGEGTNTKIHYASHTLTGNKSCGEWSDVGVDITKDFHTYGVDWEPTKITYYFDGKPYASCSANPDANKPFYMLVNLAVGGEVSWPGTPDDSNVWPAYMYVDYVRAYQKNN